MPRRRALLKKERKKKKHHHGRNLLKKVDLKKKKHGGRNLLAMEPASPAPAPTDLWQSIATRRALQEAALAPISTYPGLPATSTVTGLAEAPVPQTIIPGRRLAGAPGTLEEAREVEDSQTGRRSAAAYGGVGRRLVAWDSTGAPHAGVLVESPWVAHPIGRHLFAEPGGRIEVSVEAPEPAIVSVGGLGTGNTKVTVAAPAISAVVVERPIEHPGGKGSAPAPAPKAQAAGPALGAVTPKSEAPAPEATVAAISSPIHPSVPAAAPSPATKPPARRLAAYKSAGGSRSLLTHVPGHLAPSPMVFPTRHLLVETTAPVPGEGWLGMDAILEQNRLDTTAHAPAALFGPVTVPVATGPGHRLQNTGEEDVRFADFNIAISRFI